METIRTHLIDASALVKLLVAEQHSSVVREYFNAHTVFLTTSICFAETLGVLKAKNNRKEVTVDEYLTAASELMAYLRGGNIQIDDFAISDMKNADMAEDFVTKYGVDLADAYQLVTLKEGFLSCMEGDASPIFITADKKLANAARAESLLVWDCANEPKP